MCGVIQGDCLGREIGSLPCSTSTVGFQTQLPIGEPISIVSIVNAHYGMSSVHLEMDRCRGCVWGNPR